MIDTIVLRISIFINARCRFNNNQPFVPFCWVFSSLSLLTPLGAMTTAEKPPAMRLMSDRRALFGMLIGLSLCVSIWQISTQDASLITSEARPFADTDLNALAAAAAAAVAASSPGDVDGAASATSVAFTLGQLAADDASRLIDLTDFRFLINQPPCSEARNETDAARQLLIVIVHSAPGNWAKRNVIRETWGSSLRRDKRKDDAPLRVLFMLGAVLSSSPPQAQHKIEIENYLYGDIVQGNFVDAYRNLTYKHAMTLKWFTYFCADTAAFLVKTDDDVFMHTPNALAFLRDAGTPRQQLLLCMRRTHVRISRSYRSKWRVSPHEYAGHYFPDYCPGYAIVYSADVAVQLYALAQRTPYFWIDDVHVTGTLATAANVTITPFGMLFVTRNLHERVLQGTASAYDANAFAFFVFTAPNLQADRIRALWQRVQEEQAQQQQQHVVAMEKSADTETHDVLNAQHTSAANGS